jgi:hypothetical protein
MVKMGRPCKNQPIAQKYEIPQKKEMDGGQPSQAIFEYRVNSMSY